MYLEREGTSKASEAKWPRVKTGRGGGRPPRGFRLLNGLREKRSWLLRVYSENWTMTTNSLENKHDMVISNHLLKKKLNRERLR